MDRRAGHRDALALPLGSPARSGVEVALDVARGPCPRSATQASRARRQRFGCIAKLGQALQADAVQEVGRHDQEAVRCGRARHARSPQQRLRRVDEPAASTGPARRTSGYRSANLTGCRGVAQPCNRGGAARRLGAHAASLWAHAVSPWRAVLGVWLPFVSNLPARFGFAWAPCTRPRRRGYQRWSRCGCSSD